jgi:hypothetical protein
MLSPFPARLQRRWRNHQQGQALIILAVGFIALAAFVGLVTDISIMFVRYATLSRAVDSASVAAAGQIREGTDYASIALSARQYILFHGLEPSRVWVETCETDINDWRKGTGDFKGSPHPEASFPLSAMPKTQLCDFERPRKLVRVVAQIDSETTFLRLIGINNFVITASATSETAALDIALVLDNSASMSLDTRERHYTGRDQAGNVVLPDRNWVRVENDTVASTINRSSSSLQVPGICAYSKGEYTAAKAAVRRNEDSASVRNTNFQWGGCCNDPSTGATVTQDSQGNWRIFYDANGNGVLDGGESYGFNNTQPDGNFSDLVCEPFKQIKDAARNFIRRLDFVRGDRVGLVVFNRLASIIYPTIGEIQDIQAYKTANPSTFVPPAMMTSEVVAVESLNKFVGVFHNPTNQWGGCRAIDAAEQQVRAMIGQPANASYNYYLRPNSYEVWAQCMNTNMGDGIRYANAILVNPDTVRRDAVWVAIILSDGTANASYHAASNKSLIPATSKPILSGDPGQAVAYGDFGFCPWYTFCLNRNPADPYHNRLWRDTNGNNIIENDELYTGWTASTPTGPGAGAADTDDYPSWPECQNSIVTLQARDANAASILNRIRNVYNNSPSFEFCNDHDPVTRHFCIDWKTSAETLGVPQVAQAECQASGRYDADDYARDMADWAGLIEIEPGAKGNFIAMFSIGFGNLMTNTSVAPAAAPLMRYIADAGDNGIIDNNMQQDWRDNRALNYVDHNSPAAIAQFGKQDPCEIGVLEGTVDDPTDWCGQYYYASNLNDLEAVFEAIASRLFTRISR